MPGIYDPATSTGISVIGTCDGDMENAFLSGANNPGIKLDLLSP